MTTHTTTAIALTVPVICRFVTGHRTAATPHAFCSVEVFATNEINMGRYYVRSVHISLGITDNGQQVHHQFEVRKYGVSDDQIFSVRPSSSHEQVLSARACLSV